MATARQMAQTPEVMKRRLRVTLRQARESAGLTQKAVAAELDWSPSKIIRIEQGAVGVAPTDVRALLATYGVTDERLVAELIELARGSKKQSWSDYKSVYSKESLALFGSEAAAKIIYKYEPTFVPGLLQTADYARALLAGQGRSSDEIELMVNARLERQELLDSDARPDLEFILGEAVVSRTVGSRRIMRRQLERIKELGGRPGISLRLLPFSAGAYPRMGGAFTILEFDDEKLDDLLYLENAGGETVTRDDPELVAEYRDAFVTIEGMAIKSDGFADALDEIAAVRFKDGAGARAPSSSPPDPSD